VQKEDLEKKETEEQVNQELNNDYAEVKNETEQTDQ